MNRLCKEWSHSVSFHYYTCLVLLLVGVTILLSLTVFLNLVAETLPQGRIIFTTLKFYKMCDSYKKKCESETLILYF